MNKKGIVLLTSLSMLLFGALIGFLSGLSTSPIVASVLAGLITLIGTFINIKGRKIIYNFDQILPIIKLGLFSIGCMLGIFLGIYSRTHDLFSPKRTLVKEQIMELKEAGYSEELSKQIILFVNFGVSPKEWHYDSKKDADYFNKSKEKGTGLFSENKDFCKDFEIDSFKDFTMLEEYFRNKQKNDIGNFVSVLNRNFASDESKRKIFIEYFILWCKQ